MTEGSSNDDSLRKRLYDVMSDETLSLAETQTRALTIARKSLGVDNAHIQVRNDDGTTDTVATSVGADPEILPEGTTLDRATTYCRRTVERTTPLALSDAPNQDWADDPAYLEHGFDCYLGTTIFVAGDVYGTVCFVSRDPRDAEFTDEEKLFVELLARLLGREIQAARQHQRIEQTHQARERSEHKYEALLQLAPDAVFLADAATGEIVEVNQQATELTGYTESQLRGMDVLDLHPTEQSAQYAHLFEDSPEASPRDRFDDGTHLYIRRADGSDVPIEMSVSTVELGDQTLLQAIVRDVSDRRERERELELNEEFLEHTQELANLGGWEVRLDPERVRWTDEVYAIHGLSPDVDVAVADALGFYHPEDQATIRDAYEHLVAEGDPFDLELRIVRADGDIRWVRTLGRPYVDDDSGEIVAVRGVIQDITEQKARQQTLQVRNQAIEESPIGITIADADQPDLPLIYANEAFQQMTGYSSEKFLGNNCRFLQGQATDEDTVADLRAAIEAEEPIQTEILNYRANGVPFWNKLTVAPVSGSNDDDDPTHYVGIQEDVTAKKRRERLIEVLQRVLRHNLRNDMNIVGGFAAEIAERADGDVAEMAARILDTTNRLTGLSEKAYRLNLSVSDNESIEPRNVIKDVQVAVSELRDDYPETVFKVDVPDAAEALATPRLQLALRELGENAAKHSGQSSVRYRVEAPDEGHVTVQIQDSGPGLPECERKVLSEGRETPLNHGTGIGLWLVNWIVTGIGGSVTATVDGGTTVTVHLSTRESGRSRWVGQRNAVFSTTSE